MNPRDSDGDSEKQPLAIFFPGAPDTVEDGITHARRYMASRLHSTLTLLAEHHCAAQGWGSDHVFTKADAELPINEKFFVFSVFFSRRTFRVDINFPVIKQSHNAPEYTLQFINAPVSEMECTQPLPIGARLRIFQALLFIEQHLRLLLQELYPEGRHGLEETL